MNTLLLKGWRKLRECKYKHAWIQSGKTSDGPLGLFETSFAITGPESLRPPVSLFSQKHNLKHTIWDGESFALTTRENSEAVGRGPDSKMIFGNSCPFPGSMFGRKKTKPSISISFVPFRAGQCITGRLLEGPKSYATVHLGSISAAKSLENRIHAHALSAVAAESFLTKNLKFLSSWFFSTGTTKAPIGKNSSLTFVGNRKSLVRASHFAAPFPVLTKNLNRGCSWALSCWAMKTTNHTANAHTASPKPQLRGIGCAKLLFLSSMFRTTEPQIIPASANAIEGHV